MLTGPFVWYLMGFTMCRVPLWSRGDACGPCPWGACRIGGGRQDAPSRVPGGESQGALWAGRPGLWDCFASAHLRCSIPFSLFFPLWLVYSVQYTCSVIPKSDRVTLLLKTPPGSQRPISPPAAPLVTSLRPACAALEGLFLTLCGACLLRPLGLCTDGRIRLQPSLPLRPPTPAPLWPSLNAPFSGRPLLPSR